MKTQMKRVKREDGGFIMLEGLIVITVTVFLMFFLLAMFSVVFQKFNIQVIANETAARLAQTYGYALSSDVRTGEVTLEEAAAIDPYRYNDERVMQIVTQMKADEYVSERLEKISFVVNVTEPEVRVTVTQNGLGRRHITVGIKGGYKVPFGEFLSYHGFNEVIGYDVYAYADCIDLLNYINTVDTVKYWSSLKYLNSSAIDMVNALMRLFDNFAG